MSKLFLLKSDHERERIGDVIVVLDKIDSFHVAEVTDEEGTDYVISIHHADEDSRAWFKDKETFMSEFKRLVIEYPHVPEMVQGDKL